MQVTPWWDGPGVGPWDRRQAVARFGLAAALAACGAFPVGLVVVRRWLAGPGGFGSLVVNLALAAAPVAFALAADWFASARRTLGAACCGVLWLLFFPNAPYLVTELVDLTSQPPAPLWYDALVLASAMLAGLLATFASLRLIHLLIERRLGAAWSWVAALAFLGASGFGIYLGRFGRFNSWDVLVRPTSVLYSAGIGDGDPLPTPSAVAVTALFSGLLVVGYVVVVAISALSPAAAVSGRGRPRAAAPGGGPG